MKYIASCSLGKDSLAMILRLIEEHKPLDEIVFYDTGMEFKAIYNNWEKLKELLQDKIKFTVLKPSCPFIWTMFEKPVNVGKPNEHKGYSWCGGVCRWGTTEKLKALDKYCEERNAYCYVDIAADEPKRIEKERKHYKLFPLVNWGMTEADCLDYCRKNGFDWLEDNSDCKVLGIERGFWWQRGSVRLYDILDRVSCWCCGNKNLWELRNIYDYLPQYWQKLKDLQSKTDRPFKKDYSIYDLEEKFKNGYVPKRRKR